MDTSRTWRLSDPAPASSQEVGHSSHELVPRRCTLAGFTTEAAGAEGINVREAEPLVPILVTTKNSRYRIIPLRWGQSDVLVQGGSFFPDLTEAHLAGSTFGGSLLKMHWIMVGLHMEIATEHGVGPIVTTRVTDVRVERSAPTDDRRH